MMPFSFILAETASSFSAPDGTAVWLAIAFFIVQGINQVRLLFTKTPPDHERYANKADTKEALTALQDEIRDGFKAVNEAGKEREQAILEKIENSNETQYKARREIHKKVNSLEAGMHFIAGGMSSEGQKLKNILKEGDS